MPLATTRLNQKLDRIRGGTYQPTDFIIADAKDGEMGGGASAMGLDHKIAAGGTAALVKPIAIYRSAMKEMGACDLVDIMLTSLSSAEAMASDDVYNGHDVTQAVRLNDGTDIWGLRGASYRAYPARPFRTARLDRARELCDLGLYAVGVERTWGCGLVYAW
jgi:hypothetical protein